ncbi:MAG: ATP-binding protein [Thermodesulfobacteriota bacterium]
MKVMRKIIQIDEELCDGCGQCVPACAEGAIEVVDGKAKLVRDRYCDGLGACMGDCPTGALRIIEREAEEFDEEAVEEHLGSSAGEEKGPDPPMACGCPSSQIRTFQPERGPGRPASMNESSSPSALSHWPVQIRLVPPEAPFLKGADLLVAADCTPFAYPDFHRDFIAGRVALVGCPKFDETEEFVARFARIFQAAGIRSITAVVMEVPCCSGLPAILEKAMEKAGVRIPMEVVVLGTEGGILERESGSAAAQGGGCN